MSNTILTSLDKIKESIAEAPEESSPPSPAPAEKKSESIVAPPATGSSQEVLQTDSGEQGI